MFFEGFVFFKMEDGPGLSAKEMHMGRGFWL
jgi:hypothetical protein